MWVHMARWYVVTIREECGVLHRVVGRETVKRIRQHHRYDGGEWRGDLLLSDVVSMLMSVWDRMSR